MAVVDELTRAAVSATVHCLTGCAIGEVLGMVIGPAFGWSDAATIAIAVVLAFFFGYLLTLIPLLRSGLALRAAVGVALAADTVSIAVMEVVDNVVMVAVPGGWTPASTAASSGAAGLRAGRGLRRGAPGQPLADRPRARSRGGLPPSRPRVTATRPT